MSLYSLMYHKIVFRFVRHDSFSFLYDRSCRSSFTRYGNYFCIGSYIICFPWPVPAHIICFPWPVPARQSSWALLPRSARPATRLLWLSGVHLRLPATYGVLQVWTTFHHFARSTPALYHTLSIVRLHQIRQTDIIEHNQIPSVRRDPLILLSNSSPRASGTRVTFPLRLAWGSKPYHHFIILAGSISVGSPCYGSQSGSSDSLRREQSKRRPKAPNTSNANVWWGSQLPGTMRLCERTVS